MDQLSNAQVLLRSFVTQGRQFDTGSFENTQVIGSASLFVSSEQTGSLFSLRRYLCLACQTSFYSRVEGQARGLLWGFIAESHRQLLTAGPIHMDTEARAWEARAWEAVGMQVWIDQGQGAWQTLCWPSKGHSGPGWLQLLHTPSFGGLRKGQMWCRL